ncbi:MAG: PD40 domain-containing protein [Verrucomicrobia bacterium]|nr:PD40 domain-containing protein [Verrucomicrobiota bacterium]
MTQNPKVRLCLTAACLNLAIAASPALHEKAGKDWGVEREACLDPVTGVRVWELTKGTNAANNLYYHFSNFTADNRYLIFLSNRTGSWQLFRAEVETGRLVQLTDDPQVNAGTGCLDHTNARRLYHLRGAEVIALDILDVTTRKVGEIPEPHVGGFQQPTLSGDGKWLALGKQRDDANWEIGLMNTETGEYRTVVTQGFRIGHVQHSPTDPLIFYAWDSSGYAPQRSWIVNEDGSGNRPFYVRTDPKTWFTPLKEWVTHESWVKDTGDMTMINDKLGVMLVKKDGTARMVREGHYWHTAARPDGRLLVLDDMQGRLWLMETATGNTRLLATGIRDTVRTVHAHASFDRLGRYVQFHTGHTHETIAIIDLNELPPLNWIK